MAWAGLHEHPGRRSLGLSRVLVTYATLSGSTAEVAEAIGEQLSDGGLEVDVLPLESVIELDPFDAVVVGGPMILGWHRGALRFLRKHRQVWRTTPLAVFVTAMSLTDTGVESVDGVPVVIDEKLLTPPASPGRLSLRERYANVSNYVGPIVAAARPAMVGVFGGKLNFGELKWWAALFALFIVQARAGDQRNWDAIRGWAGTLPETLGLPTPRPA